MTSLTTSQARAKLYKLLDAAAHLHEPIQITERNRRVTQAACRSCHEAIVETIDGHGQQQQTDCLSWSNSRLRLNRSRRLLKHVPEAARDLIRARRQV